MAAEKAVKDFKHKYEKMDLLLCEAKRKLQIKEESLKQGE